MKAEAQPVWVRLDEKGQSKGKTLPFAAGAMHRGTIRIVVAGRLL